MDQVIPLLKPDNVKRLVGVLLNATDLLTNKFVNQATELMGSATPVSLSL